MKKLYKTTGTHYVFFADDLGIASVFQTLKSRLSGPCYQHVSLFYCSLNSQHNFQKELNLLQQHFPCQLFVIYHSKEFAGHCILQQDDIEAVINANTMPQMSFIISGNESFVHTIKELLIFLGIENIQIQEQYFSE